MFHKKGRLPLSHKICLSLSLSLSLTHISVFSPGTILLQQVLPSVQPGLGSGLVSRAAKTAVYSRNSLQLSSRRWTEIYLWCESYSCCSKVCSQIGSCARTIYTSTLLIHTSDTCILHLWPVCCIFPEISKQKSQYQNIYFSQMIFNKYSVRIQNKKIWNCVFPQPLKTPWSWYLQETFPYSCEKFVLCFFFFKISLWILDSCSWAHFLRTEEIYASSSLSLTLSQTQK